MDKEKSLFSLLNKSKLDEKENNVVLHIYINSSTYDWTK
jgi:hypothetical protein